MNILLVPEGPKYQLKYRVMVDNQEAGVVYKKHVRYRSPAAPSWSSRLVWFVEGKDRPFLTRQDAVDWLAEKNLAS